MTGTKDTGAPQTPEEAAGFGRTSLVVGRLESGALGRRMAQDWHGQYVYVTRVGWHAWDGRRWKPVEDVDMLDAALSWVEDLLVALLRAVDPDGELKRVQRYRGVRNAAELVKGAQSAEALRVDVDDLDQSEGLLNCLNGVVDLRTGALLPHDPALLMTKIAGAEYRPGATHPDWQTALTALPDVDTIRYVQVHVGSAASGETDRVGPVAFHQGEGANGKTTVLGGILAAFGDYGTLIPDALLTASEGHETVWMPLRGARLAYLEELPEDHVLPIAKIKKLAETPTLKARLMRQNFVEFRTTHTLLVSTNYKPRVTETDHGTWRRLTMIPYPFTFDGDARDVTLRHRVKTGEGQLAAVLAWIVEGARAWYAAGRILPPPGREVELTTAEWRADSDPLAEWLEANVHVDNTTPSARVLTSTMHEAFNLSQPYGAKPWSVVLFGGRLRSNQWIRGHNLTVDRGARGREAAGISGLHMAKDCPESCPQWGTPSTVAAAQRGLWKQP